MATLLRPRDTTKKQIDLSTKDIAAYAELVGKSPITSTDLTAVKGTDAEKQVKNVLDTFTPSNLVAGSEILTALAATLNLEGKTLRFDRTAIMALIRGNGSSSRSRRMPPRRGSSSLRRPRVSGRRLSLRRCPSLAGRVGSRQGRLPHPRVPPRLPRLPPSSSPKRPPRRPGIDRRRRLAPSRPGNSPRPAWVERGSRSDLRPHLSVGTDESC